MRYAVISDIHGNLSALEAVLKDAREQGAEEYILLGDYCNHWFQTSEALDRLASLPVLAAVRGNEDEHTLLLREQNQQSWTDGQFRTVYWTFRRLEPGHVDFLSSLPEEAEIFDGEGICFHKPARYFEGTVLDSIFTDVYARRYKEKPISRAEFVLEFEGKAARDALLRERLHELPHGIFLFGHCHVQYHYWIEGKLLLNPGSCGMNFDGEPGAPYTILERRGDSWHVEERRVMYDVEAEIANMRQSELFREAPVWCEIIETGLRRQREVTYSFLEHIARYAEAIGDPVRPYSKATWEAAFNTWPEKP